MRTKLNNKLINVLYFYRKADEENLAKCKALCKKDVSLYVPQGLAKEISEAFK